MNLLSPGTLVRISHSHNADRITLWQTSSWASDPIDEEIGDMYSGDVGLVIAASRIDVCLLCNGMLGWVSKRQLDEVTE